MNQSFMTSLTLLTKDLLSMM